VLHKKITAIPDPTESVMPAKALLRLLTFSTLYPNAATPNHGVFVENRLRHLVGSGQASATVVAPVPYFPSRSPVFGHWAQHAAAPREESRNGLRVFHPRYPVIPRFGMTLAPWLLYRASLPELRRLLATGLHFDLIDAHYLYPDGVAAVWLGRALKLPVVITARGSDVTQIPDYPLPRRMILGAIADADALITVSAALRTQLIELGAPAAKVTVLRNGVDTTLFRPGDRPADRKRLALDGPTLLSVGHLIDRKGHHRIIEAMPALPEYRLLIAGEGPERPRLESLIAKHGLADRVRLLGARPHAELPSLYGAADALVLASSREGWANVLLEALACGTPVLASQIPGNPEVIQEPAAGRLFAPNEPAAIAEGVRTLFAKLPERAATRAYAERFGWEETTAGQLELFRRVLADRVNARA
jgi:teichuronic acid biosynthesis glycosyltransferase TuaC